MAPSGGKALFVLGLPLSFEGKAMSRSRYGKTAALGGFAAAACSVLLAGSAIADTAYSSEGATGSFLKILSERLDFTISQVPALGTHLASLGDIVGGRTALLLLGILVAGAGPPEHPAPSPR